MDTDARFDDLIFEGSPDNFIIAEKYWEDEKDEDLTTFLTKNFPVIVQEDHYIVFDLRERD